MGRDSDAYDISAAPRGDIGRKPLFNERPTFCAAVGLLLGVLLAAGLSAGYARIAALAVFCACVGAALAKRRMWMVLLLFLAAGLLRASFAPVYALPEGKYTVAGRVCEAPIPTERGLYVLLDDLTLDAAPVEGRVRFFATFGTEPAYGQRVEAPARVKPSSGRWINSDRAAHIAGNAYAYGIVSPRGEPSYDAYGKLLALRQAIGERIEVLFPSAPGAARGMLVGDVTGLDEATLEAFRDTGILHLLSVSGLHVAVLAGALSVLLRRNAWARFLVIALFLVLYSAITAFSPPVLRSSAMLLFALLAFPLRRRLDPLSSLSAAFILLALWNPYSVFRAGFQLSFCAVYGLALLTPIFRRPLRRLGEQASSLIAASGAAVIATFPASCACFGSAQLLSIVTNLFVLPIADIFLIPAFAGTALSFVWYPLGSAVCAVARVALDAIMAVTLYGGSLTVFVPAPSGIAQLLFLATMLLASRLCLRSPKRRALYTLAGALLTAAAWGAG